MLCIYLACPSQVPIADNAASSTPTPSTLSSSPSLLATVLYIISKEHSWGLDCNFSFSSDQVH